jgi:hypothetical protein
MSRNRIIYNVQDLYVGSLTDEEDLSITGASGFHILQRLERVQSVAYDIKPNVSHENTLGKSSAHVDSYHQPHEVSCDFTYINYGINNEHRLGFNNDGDLTPSAKKGRNMIHDFALSDAISGRNLYLIVNQKSDDIHDNSDAPVYPAPRGTSFTSEEVVDPDSQNYNVIVFQNSHVRSYNVEGSVGSLVSSSVSLNADNIIGYASGSGINIPYLDLKSGVTVDNPIGDIYESNFDSSTDGWYGAGTFATEDMAEAISDDVPLSYVSNFDTDEDGWDAKHAAATVSTTYSPLGQQNQSAALKVILDTASTSHYLSRPISFAEGKKYKLTGKVYLPSGQTTDGFKIMTSVTNDAIHDCYSPSVGGNCVYDEWKEFSVEFTAESSSVGIYIFGIDGGTGSYTPGSNDIIYITDFALWRLDRDIVNPRLTFTTNANGSHGDHYLVKKNCVTVGKKYRLTGKINISSDSVNMDRIEFWNGPSDLSAPNTRWQGVGGITTLGNWVNFDMEFIATEDSLYIYGLEGAGDYNFAGSVSDQFSIKNVKITDITEIKKFIIPRSFDKSELCYPPSSLMLKPGNIDVYITRSEEGGMTFHTQHIQEFKLGISIDREKIKYVGYKMVAANPVRFPVVATLDLDMLNIHTPSGSFVDNAKIGYTYDIDLNLKTDDGSIAAKYTILGATLEAMSSQGSIGQNEGSSLNFSVSMDFEDNSRGLFCSGMLDSVCAQVLDENNNIITDENGVTIGTSIYYPRY